MSSVKLFRDVLQASGYRTLEATTGERAVELALEERPDLVLMDIQLPGIGLRRLPLEAGGHRGILRHREVLLRRRLSMNGRDCRSYYAVIGPVRSLASRLGEGRRQSISVARRCSGDVAREATKRAICWPFYGVDGATTLHVDPRPALVEERSVGQW